MAHVLTASPKGKRTPWAWIVGTFFGAGYWNPGPGTAGSLAAAVLWWLLSRLTVRKFPHLPMLTATQLIEITAGAALLLLVIAIPASTIMARESGRKDPQRVVADEAVGQWITLLAAPANAQFTLIGFLLFRAFDVWKPPPVRQMEYLPEGWGIMLDDVGAGVYAWICLQLIHHWWK